MNTAEELISSLTLDANISSELCNVARAASAMVDEIFHDADINTQTLKLAEECDELYAHDAKAMDGLVDVAIVSLQLIYDYKSMIGLCALRGALQEFPLQTEEAWKEFLSACHFKISTNYMRNALGYWREASDIRVTTYGRNPSL